MIEKDYLPQYAAEAVRDLELGYKNAALQAAAYHGSDKQNFLAFAESYRYIASLLRQATHIVLPPNGEIYRDNKVTGPSDQECPSLTGLPAPITSFEYAWTHDLDGHVNPSYSLINEPLSMTNPPKRITLVIDGKQLIEIEGEDKSLPTKICFMSICYHESVKRWNPQPTSVTVLDPFKVYPMSYPDGRKGWGTKAEVYDLVNNRYIEEKDKELGSAIFSEFQGDISLVVQACHALRVGALLEHRKEKSYTKNRTMDKQGVGGFEYHVLRLPHGTVKETLGSRSGEDRDGPRYHFRRAHLRNLSSGAQTFVRSCFVGNREKGVVDKSYEVKKGEAA